MARPDLPVPPGLRVIRGRVDPLALLGGQVLLGLRVLPVPLALAVLRVPRVALVPLAPRAQPGRVDLQGQEALRAPLGPLLQ